MTKSKKATILLFMIMLFLFLSPVNIVALNDSLSTTSSSSEEIIDVVILKANYTDIDHDGYKDDIYAEVKIELSGSTFYALDYYVELSLPSGTSFSYSVVVNTNMNELILKNLFYNHALESGYYKLTVEIVLKNGGMLYDDHTFIFDPPGGSDGADPSFDIL